MPSSATVNACDNNSYTSTNTLNSVASPAELSSSSSTDRYRCEGAVENVYTKSFQMVVSSHTPPAPFGLDYDTPPPEQHPDPTSLSQEALRFSCRPQEGQKFPGNTKELTITSVIRTGAGRGPQVVVVNSSMVAKIFDQLFYDASERPDVSAIVPAFYGTWTLDAESTIVRDGQRNVRIRPVRMILIEQLDGQCTIDLNAQELTKLARTVILKQCLHAYIQLYHAGVDHGDFCPRNIMIMGSDFVTPNVQCCVYTIIRTTYFELSCCLAKQRQKSERKSSYRHSSASLAEWTRFLHSVGVRGAATKQRSGFGSSIVTTIDIFQFGSSLQTGTYSRSM